MKELNTKIIDIIDRTPNIKSFRCKSNDDIDFSAGQFMRVSLIINGKEETKSITISNSPTEKGYYEFSKKITDSSFSQSLNNLKKGDPIRIKLPYGSFIINGNENNKIAFLSGGIGITPIRSICKYLFDKKSKTDIILIYGNHTEKDIVFKDDIDDFQGNLKNFKVIYTLDSVNNIKEWKGQVGLINKQMIKEEIPDYKERIFYICGSKNMVTSMENILKELQISTDKIIKEKFI